MDRTWGLSRSVGYMLENEAYCQLPAFIKKHFRSLLSKNGFLKKQEIKY